MKCNQCSNEMNEKNYSSNKDSTRVNRFECECCKKIVIIIKKTDGSVVKKERIVE